MSLIKNATSTKQGTQRIAAKQGSRSQHDKRHGGCRSR
jgi:hypothetical protein